MSDSNEKTCNDSKQTILVVDLIRSILERLSFVDFHRARCVSSGWYSASKSCIAGTKNPWIILFPRLGNSNNINLCKLFDPQDHSSYIIRDIGFDMARSRCLASSGSWFLMLEYHGTELHLLNLFTRERIPLPSLDSVHGPHLKYKTTSSEKVFYCRTDVTINNAVLWIDEINGNYLVVWNLGSFIAYHKKGDDDEDKNSWKVLHRHDQTLKKNQAGCISMAFKESKLYVLSGKDNLTVFDFSVGNTPVECETFSPSSQYGDFPRGFQKNLVVTLSGEVLIIEGRVEPHPGRCFLTVYKIYPISSKWLVTKSIGDQALLLDLGIAIPARDGVEKNCIYFSNDQFHRYTGTSLCSYDNKNSICVYHIGVGKVINVFDHLTINSPIPFMDARWFFPTLGGNRLL